MLLCIPIMHNSAQSLFPMQTIGEIYILYAFACFPFHWWLWVYVYEYCTYSWADIGIFNEAHLTLWSLAHEIIVRQEIVQLYKIQKVKIHIL